MTDLARRRRTEAVCDAALDREAGERAAFVVAACGDDHAMRQEVEALLAHAQTDDGFLAVPIEAVAANLLREALGESLVGQQIGSYEILSHIGAGGMGEVYRARDLRLGRDVAIKTLPVDVSPHHDDRTRFQHEARVIASLNHPHICILHDVGQEDRFSYLVMEYLEGPTLKQRLLENAPLPLNEALRIASEIADALAEAHRHGIVHRDVKPGNIKLTKSGAKLLDFGLARAFGQVDAQSKQALTARGIILGTPWYMSPEQVLGKHVDTRSDVFSLGVVIYEMITGHRPFDGANVIETIDAVLHTHPEAVSVLNPDAPAELEQLATRCLEKDKEHRYQSIEDLWTDLRAALADHAENPRFIETLPSRRGYRFTTPFADRTVTDGSPGSGNYKARLAVLPFANVSDDAGQDYFSDGLTEEMILQLGRLGRERLSVIARTSSSAFKGRTWSAREIGETLRADYLLEGSVRRDGDHVRITASLVETSSETHLWTDAYERHVTDCLSVQSDVAGRIAQSLALELLPEQPVQPSTDAAAYQTYWKGRYYWNLPGDQGFEQAIVYFRQACAVDPGFAAAHADLARTYTGQAEYYNVVPRVALETARPIAKRSLELDPHLSHAHITMANIRAMLDWDWDAAEAGFRQAIALNPSSDGAHRWYGLLLAGLGKSSEAVREAQRARELDPLCLVVGTSAAWTQYVAGDYEAAIDTCRNVMDMKPQFTAAWRVLGASLIQIGRAAEGVAELEAAAANAPADPVLLAWLAHAKATRGECGVARTILDALDRLRAQRFVPAYHVALAHIGLGQHDEAFRLLDQACEERDPALMNVVLDPRFDGLHSDARFQRLVARLHLRG